MGTAGATRGCDNHMTHWVPSLCFLTQAPQRDSGSHSRFADEEMRLREVQWQPKVTKLRRKCKPCCLQDSLQALRGSCVFCLVGILPPQPQG